MYVIPWIIIDGKNTKKYRTFYNRPKKRPQILLKCANPATKVVCYQVEGATVIERYCDKCAKVIEDTLPK